MQYSVVIPIYKDAYLAETCIQRLDAVFRSMAAEAGHTDLDNWAEIILVTDGIAGDYETLKELSTKWGLIRVIRLSRNFGQHNAISAGFEAASGAFVIRMNVDCQDAPEDIPRLLEEQRHTGAAQVIGIYPQRQSSWMDRFTAWLFFRFFNWLTGFHTPQSTSSLRVMTRDYIRAYNELPESSRLPQGLDEYLGFTKAYIPIQHHPRVDAVSSYTFSRRMKLAIDAAVSFSDRPMVLIFNLGLALFALGNLFFIYNLALYFFKGVSVSGYTSLVLLLTLFSSVIYIAIGTLGLYIGNIQREVKRRPYYIIENTLNFPQ